MKRISNTKLWIIDIISQLSLYRWIKCQNHKFSLYIQYSFVNPNGFFIIMIRIQSDRTAVELCSKMKTIHMPLPSKGGTKHENEVHYGLTKQTTLSTGALFAKHQQEIFGVEGYVNLGWWKS